MSRKRFRLLLLVTGVVGVLVVAGVALLNHGDEIPHQSQLLSDGSIIMVRAITSGPRNRLVEGNLFQRFAGQFLPDAWAQKIGATITRVPVATRQPVLWLERRWPTNAPPPATGNPFGFFVTQPAASLPGTMPAGKYRFTIAVTDDSGTRLDAPVWTFRRNPACDLMPVLLNGLPTDHRTLRLAIEPARDVWRLSQRTFFDVPNPSFRKHRKWRASPCPITVEQDDLTFRLHHFGPPEAVMQRDPVFPDTDLTCEILDRAAPTNQWSVLGVHISNEAGDEGSFNLRRYKTRGCRSSYFFPGTLSTNLAWKLRFQLSLVVSPPAATNMNPAFALTRKRVIEVIAQPIASPL